MPTARLGLRWRGCCAALDSIWFARGPGGEHPRSNSRGVPGEHFVVLSAIAIALLNDLFFGLQAWLSSTLDLDVWPRRGSTARLADQVCISLRLPEQTGQNSSRFLSRGKCFAQIGLALVQRGFLGLPRLAQFGDLGLDLVRSALSSNAFCSAWISGFDVRRRDYDWCWYWFDHASVTAAATSTATPSAWETETAHAHARVPLGIHDLAD